MAVPPAGADSGPAPGVHPRSHWQIWTVAAGVAALISLGTLGYWLKSPLPPPKVLRAVQITSDGHQKLVSDLFPVPVVTDGARVYFPQSVTGTIGLAQVSLAGGETVPVRCPSKPRLIPFSWGSLRTGPSYSFGISGDPRTGLWILPVLGGSPRRLGDLLSLGRSLVSGRAKDGLRQKLPDLYVAKSDGSESRKLLTLTGKPWMASLVA